VVFGFTLFSGIFREGLFRRVPGSQIVAQILIDEFEFKVVEFEQLSEGRQLVACQPAVAGKDLGHQRGRASRNRLDPPAHAEVRCLFVMRHQIVEKFMRRPIVVNHRPRWMPPFRLRLCH